MLPPTHMPQLAHLLACALSCRIIGGRALGAAVRPARAAHALVAGTLQAWWARGAGEEETMGIELGG